MRTYVWPCAISIHVPCHVNSLNSACRIFGNKNPTRHVLTCRITSNMYCTMLYLNTCVFFRTLADEWGDFNINLTDLTSKLLGVTNYIPAYCSPRLSSVDTNIFGNIMRPIKFNWRSLWVTFCDFMKLVVSYASLS